MTLGSGHILAPRTSNYREHIIIGGEGHDEERAHFLTDNYFQGLKPQPGDEVENSEGFEAVKLATVWKRRLDQQRKHAATNLPLDSFGLRKTNLNTEKEASMRDYLKTPRE